MSVSAGPIVLGCLAEIGGPEGRSSSRMLLLLQQFIVEPVKCLRKFDWDFPGEAIRDSAVTLVDTGAEGKVTG